MSAPESAKPGESLAWLTDAEFLYAAAITIEGARPQAAARLRAIADRASQRQPERDERAAFEAWVLEHRRSTWRPLLSDPRSEMPSHWGTAFVPHQREGWEAGVAWALASPQDRPASDEYRRANPLGGPAATFDGIADLIRAGDPVEFAMRAFGVQWVQDRTVEP